MKPALMLTHIFALLTIMSSATCFAQAGNREKILATWDVSKVEILKAVEDSVTRQEQLKGVSLTFQRDTLIIRKRHTGEKDQFIKSGPYRLSDDGKKIFLNDQPAEILKLDNLQLLLSVQGEYTMHLVKRSSWIN